MTHVVNVALVVLFFLAVYLFTSLVAFWVGANIETTLFGMKHKPLKKCLLYVSYALVLVYTFPFLTVVWVCDKIGQLVRFEESEE